VVGASAHNLAAIDIDVPAGGLVAVTGVSGSGKSSLVFDVIAPSVAAAIEAGRHAAAPVACVALVRAEPFERVVPVAALAAATSPWSSPAGVVGMLEALRDLFAATSEARARGLKKSHFSTAAKGGRCETCEGLGLTRVSMDFLPDVWSTCEDCGGRRFGPEVLACTIAGHTLADVLDMNVVATRAFAEGAGAAPRAWRTIARGLDALHDVGLGYLAIGQPVRTLSGGERQRLVLAEALARAEGGWALFLMDEPTTGLHADDVHRLLETFDRLIDAGHTVVVVEHHVDVIAAADWVIDLGPEGGTAGGRLVAAGTPEAIAASEVSWTGRALSQATSRGACS
jgi:excinuclease ABC subunit A